MKIKINGEDFLGDQQEITAKVKDLRKERTTLIVNGFQRQNLGEVREGDELFIIPKDQLPPSDQLEAMMAARHTPGIHEKLKAGKVAIAGLGGLGSYIALALARLGVGKLLLVDDDVVEPSNLNRQSYYIRHLGMKKTQALREQIQDINPFISVDIRDEKVREENAREIFKGYPIVCEAFDHPESKGMLVSTLMANDSKVKLVCGSGMAGHESANRIQSRRPMKNLYICGDEVSEAREGRGLMIPRVQVCAGHQANMVLRLLLGIEEV